MTSGDLFEDNIGWGIPAVYMQGWASSHNVCSYNYATNCAYGVNTTWFMKSFWTHDAYTHMDLLEGNCGGGACHDDIHGTGGYDVSFRNRYLGYEPGRPGSSIPLQADYYHWNMSAVGNILGYQGYHNRYITNDGNMSAIYCFGYEEGTGSSETNTQYTFYMHGNYDVVNGSVQWNATNADHNIPASLLYTTKPTWFGDRPWPPYDPTNGAAIAANGLSLTNIPAGYRYIYGVDPPDSGVTATPTFSPGAGSYGTNVTVSVTNSTAGSTNYVSTNAVSWSQYAGPVMFTNTTTWYAYAVLTNNFSATNLSLYTITNASPVVNTNMIYTKSHGKGKRSKL